MVFYTAVYTAINSPLFFIGVQNVYLIGAKNPKKEKFCKGLYEIARLVQGAPGSKNIGGGGQKKGHHQGAPSIFVSL